MKGLAITVFGVLAVTFMMMMYTLERRHPGFVLAFVQKDRAFTKVNFSLSLMAHRKKRLVLTYF